MKTTTAQEIIKFIKDKKQATAKQLVDNFLITPRAIFKQLKTLSDKGVIDKIGKPPTVYYFLKEDQSEGKELTAVDKTIKKFIDINYLIISPSGEIKPGWEGFQYWCIKNSLDIIKTAQEYVKEIKKYQAFRRGGLINGISKIKNTFPKVYLDNLFYVDFYSILRFGKTKLGQVLLYAKQSQNRRLIKELSDEIKPQITKLIAKYNIEAVGFIPPTVKRETQFIKELAKNLNLSTTIIPIIKLKTPIIVPQKTLSKLADRVENAQTTIIVESDKKFSNILLVDDAVGSGATLNETARQIKEKRICAGKIIGLSITGSFKGFDVISEV